MNFHRLRKRKWRNFRGSFCGNSANREKLLTSLFSRHRHFAGNCKLFGKHPRRCGLKRVGLSGEWMEGEGIFVGTRLTCRQRATPTLADGSLHKIVVDTELGKIQTWCWFWERAVNTELIALNRPIKGGTLVRHKKTDLVDNPTLPSSQHLQRHCVASVCFHSGNSIVTHASTLRAISVIYLNIQRECF